MVKSVQKSVGLVTLGFAAVAGVSPAAAQSAPNDRLFKQRCSICHAVVAGRPNTMGPNLKGVVGRKSGSTTFAYSPAMKASKLVWNQATLDRYLAAPSKVVPGTRMVVAVPDAAQRAEIIKYLTTVK